MDRQQKPQFTNERGAVMQLLDLVNLFLKIYLSWLGDTKERIVMGTDNVEGLTEELVLNSLAPNIQEFYYNVDLYSTFLHFATGFNLK